MIQYYLIPTCDGLHKLEACKAVTTAPITEKDAAITLAKALVEKNIATKVEVQAIETVYIAQCSPTLPGAEG